MNNIDVIELFATSEIKEKIERISPWKGCSFCNTGIDPIKLQFCECTLPVILSLILDIPKRYDVDIKLKPHLVKQLDVDLNFMVLQGENKYMNIVAYFIAKKLIQKGQLVKYVESKQYITSDDVVALNKADVVLFQDIYKTKSDLAYKSSLLKRLGKELKTIFIGPVEIIKDDEIPVFEIDATDVEVLDGIK